MERFATFCLVLLVSFGRADARDALPLLEAVKASDAAAVRTLLKAGAAAKTEAFDF